MDKLKKTRKFKKTPPQTSTVSLVPFRIVIEAEGTLLNIPQKCSINVCYAEKVTKHSSNTLLRTTGNLFCETDVSQRLLNIKKSLR